MRRFILPMPIRWWGKEGGGLWLCLPFWIELEDAGGARFATRVTWATTRMAVACVVWDLCCKCESLGCRMGRWMAGHQGYR